MAGCLHGVFVGDWLFGFLLIASSFATIERLFILGQLDGFLFTGLQWCSVYVAARRHR